MSKEYHPVKYVENNTYSLYGICNKCYKLKKYCIYYSMSIPSSSFPYICPNCERPFCNMCYTQCIVCKHYTKQLCYTCSRFMCNACFINFNNSCIMCQMDKLLEDNEYVVSYNKKENECICCKNMTESECPKCKSNNCIGCIGNKASCSKCNNI
jgi:hypothetical protein